MTGNRIDDPPWRAFMKLAVALAAPFISARAGSATGPSTPPPGPGVGGSVRRALAVAAVVLLACRRILVENEVGRCGLRALKEELHRCVFQGPHAVHHAGGSLVRPGHSFSPCRGRPPGEGIHPIRQVLLGKQIPKHEGRFALRSKPCDPATQKYIQYPRNRPVEFTSTAGKGSFTKASPCNMARRSRDFVSILVQSMSRDRRYWR